MTVVHCKRDSYDVYIGRPSKFGNPFHIGIDGNRRQVLEKFREYAINRFATDLEWRKAVQSLKGKRLGCWCAPSSCHGDILFELSA